MEVVIAVIMAMVALLLCSAVASLWDRAEQERIQRTKTDCALYELVTQLVDRVNQLEKQNRDRLRVGP